MTPKTIRLAILSLSMLCYFPLNHLYASDQIDSLSVVKNTLQAAPQCLDYHITGTCFWLRCVGPACHVETTLKVEHYLPDLVVSSYTHYDNNPWLFAQKIADPVFYRLGQQQLRNFSDFKMGWGDQPANLNDNLNNKFHEVDLIGNPALTLLSRYPLILSSTVKPYAVYYSSLIDAYAWRFLGLERFNPNSLIPDLHEVGKFLINDWGSLYPRNGFVNQPNDAKAAAVTAMRAASIISEAGQPHLYQFLSQDCGQACYVDRIKENSQDTQFQLIYPKVSQECSIFASHSLPSSDPFGTNVSLMGHHRYMWVLWRHYHGCIRDQGAKYLGQISF